MKRIFRSNFFWFILVYAAVFTVYLFSLCPTIYLEDSAEYATVAATLGISHPSGYPLYVLLGKLFTFLPWGNVAWRVNLMSAFFGALTCAFLFLIIQKIFGQINGRTKKRKNEETEEQTIQNNFFVTLLLYYLLPFSCSLIFAFTQIFWSQSVVAEVYTLNTFFVTMIIWLLLVWAEKIGGCHSDDSAATVEEESHSKEYEKVRTRSLGRCDIGLGMTTEKKDKLKNKADKLLLLTVFLYGLSLANHEMMALFAPIFLIFILWHDWRIIKDYKFIFAAAFLLIIGLSLYLYLPIRASQNPAFNWGDPSNWNAFKGQILRRQYNDFAIGWQTIFNSDKLALVNGFFERVADQFTILGVFIAFFGFLINYFKNKKTFFLLFGIFLTNSLLIIVLRSFTYSPLLEIISRVYYLPAFFIVAIWLALGFKFLFDLFFLVSVKFSIFFRKIIFSFIVILIFFLPLSFLLNNWFQNNRSDFWFLDNWARQTLLSVKKDAVIAIYNDQPALDSMIFSLFYMKVVEGIRPDVELVNVGGIAGRTVPMIIQFTDKKSSTEQNIKIFLTEKIWDYGHVKNNRPVYILYPLGNLPGSKFVSRSNGYLYRVYENLAVAKKDKIIFYSTNQPENTVYEPLKFDVFFSDLLSDYYLAQAGYYLETGQKDLSQKLLLDSIKYDTSPLSFNYQAFVEQRAQWNGSDKK